MAEYRGARSGSTITGSHLHQDQPGRQHPGTPPAMGPPVISIPPSHQSGHILSVFHVNGQVFRDVFPNRKSYI